MATVASSDALALPRVVLSSVAPSAKVDAETLTEHFVDERAIVRKPLGVFREAGRFVLSLSKFQLERDQLRKQRGTSRLGPAGQDVFDPVAGRWLSSRIQTLRTRRSPPS